MTTLSSIITPNNLVTATNTETLTNKTIDGDNNTITNIDLAGDVKGTLPVANLQQTDWVELGDVSDPANPPYLTNKAEFTTYRAALRAIAVNPPVTVSEWPVKPEEIWSA